MLYIEDKEFIGINFAEDNLVIADYEDCKFIRCMISGADISYSSFENCSFQECDLSLCKVIQTSFRDTEFKKCKVLGVHFENCKDFRFSINLTSCLLDHSSFYRKKLKSTKLVDCSLIDVDFSEADLSKAQFNNCNLSGAKFENTNLSECDFRGAINFSINPGMNTLFKTKFSKEGIVGLVDYLSIVIE
jgi:fluoroquinolone resistance protein